MSGRQSKLLYYGCGRRRNGRCSYTQPCSSPHLRGERLEAAIWTDCEGFLRNPQAVLEELAAQRAGHDERAEAVQADLARLAGELDAKAKERNAVITLGIRGLIDEAEMEAQRSRILLEEERLKAYAATLQGRLKSAESVRASEEAVEELLRELNQKADGPWSFEEKRRVVSTLVKGIVVEKGEGGEPMVRVQYRFEPVMRDLPNTSASTTLPSARSCCPGRRSRGTSDRSRSSSPPAACRGG
jgi:hypothetical protein